MTQQKQTIGHRTEKESTQSGPYAGGGEPLLAGVEGLGDAAREIAKDCKRGAEAVKTVRARRNESGQ